MQALIRDLLDESQKGTAGFSYRHFEGVRNYGLAEIVSLARRYSHLICEHSRPDSLVLLSLRQGVLGPVLFLACLFQGRIPAFVAHPSEKVRPEDFSYKLHAITNLIKPDCIFCEAQDQEYFVSAPVKSVVPYKVPPLEELPIHEGPNPRFAQFSSGSTGIPKAMLYDLYKLESHLQDFEKALNWDFEPRFISWLPLYHDMGLIACLLFPLFRKKSVHYLDPFFWVADPKSLLLDALEFHCNVTWMPNFAYSLISKRCADLALDMSGFRCMASCAEPVMVHTVKEFYQTFKPNGLRADALSVTYAMAENIFAMTHKVMDLNSDNWYVRQNLEDGLEADFVSCGPPLPLTEIRIASEDKNKILIRSPYMLNAYWNQTSSLDPQGWFDTGDCGFLRNGELYVAGRASDLIIVNGVNVFPQAVESVVDEVFSTVPGRNVCLGRVNQDTGTEELLVLAESKESGIRESLELKIREQILRKLDLVPTLVRVVPHQWLRKTSSGKIARKPNLQKFQDARDRQCLVLGCSHVYSFNRSDELYNQHSTAKNLCLEQVPIASCLNIFNEPRLTQVRDALKKLSRGSLCVFLIGEQDIRTVMPFWQMHKNIARPDCAQKVVSLWNDYIRLLKQEFSDLEFAWFFPPPPGEGLKPHPRFVARTELGDEQYYHYLATQQERRQNAQVLREEANARLIVPLVDIWDQVLIENTMEIRPDFIRDNSHLKAVKQHLEWALEKHFSILFMEDKVPQITQKRVVQELTISEEICTLVRQHFSVPVEPVSNLLHVLNSIDIVRLLGLISDTYIVELPSTWLDKKEIETPLLLSQWILKHRKG